jgi:class 3 adenylate cyclase
VPARSKGKRRFLATVLFTDIVGSTDVASELGDRRWRELLDRHHTIVRRELKRFRGREIDTAGDGFFATFEAPADGIRCACAASLVAHLATDAAFHRLEVVWPRLWGACHHS